MRSNDDCKMQAQPQNYDNFFKFYFQFYDQRETYFVSFLCLVNTPETMIFYNMTKTIKLFFLEILCGKSSFFWFWNETFFAVKLFFCYTHNEASILRNCYGNLLRINQIMVFLCVDLRQSVWLLVNLMDNYWICGELRIFTVFRSTNATFRINEKQGFCEIFN